MDTNDGIGCEQVFKIGKNGLTDSTFWTCLEKLAAEFGESATDQRWNSCKASRMQPKLHVGRFLGHAQTGSILIMTTGVVEDAWFRGMNAENRWNVCECPSCSPLCHQKGSRSCGGFFFKLHKSSICLWRRRRFVKTADLGKYGVTNGCSACSDIAVHGKNQHLTQKSGERGLPSKWSTKTQTRCGT